jgi:polyribonucleotide nucleotidyltransferase
MFKTVAMEFSGKPLSIEVGKLAKQADGAAMIRYGETAVFVSAVAEKKLRKEIASDFLPLTVDYRERAMAVGKIPGGFYKREGKPTDRETLISRLIDRPLRPLFGDNFFFEVQILATVYSADTENDPGLMAVIGASSALTVSDIPFNGPIAAVRVGYINGQFVANPTRTELEASTMNIVVAGSEDAIMMVEGGANNLPDDLVVDAIFFGHQAMQPIIALQRELQKAVGKPKRTVTPKLVNREWQDIISSRYQAQIRALFDLPSKLERQRRFDLLRDEVVTFMAQGRDLTEADKYQILAIFGEIEEKVFRRMLIKENVRIAGRGFEEVRPIECEVGLLARTHGSALFTRGETQAFAITTLGTAADEQRIEGLEGESSKAFMLHYNFPPFSVGEVRMNRGPGRREIGHGALAERALEKVLPLPDDFPYTIRLVSDIMESNGSSSMATVCSGCLALMDAGVPIQMPVAGIAMGLMMEGDEYRVLSDIMGEEDHMGDMDFKVAGTSEGITALQMDNKLGGISKDILREAILQAKRGIKQILDIMSETLNAPRDDLSAYAPRIFIIKIKPDRVKDIIGPGGKIIKKIIEETGVKIDVDDDGKVQIAAGNESAAKKALRMIMEQTQEAVIGKVYDGKVKRITDFGAFIEIIPGLEGLLHISQMSNKRINKVTDVMQEGDTVTVKVLEIDPAGKVRLGKKDL